MNSGEGRGSGAGWVVPVLAAGTATLRAWTAEDAPVLWEAWNDPLIESGSEVPPDRSLAAAQRWIAGAAHRAEAGRALDLVIDQGGVCMGEVGIGPVDQGRQAALMGWWVAAQHRGQGLATAAAGALADWLLGPGGLSAVLVEIGLDNPASQRTAAGAGFSVLRPGSPGQSLVMVRRRENN